MAYAGGKKGMPHLFSGLIASSLVAVGLFAGKMVATHYEHTTISSTAPEVFPLKNQGLAFQRAAVHAPNVLPLYGSSELLVPAVPEKGNNFFRTAPTGFQVSPVGGGGTNPLIIVEKIGALGADLRDKEVVISLSPGWFFTPNPTWRGYEGTFSAMAASEIIFGTVLDTGLKREIASRMLQCPSTLKKSPLLEFALRRLASGRWLDRIIFYALWPAGRVQTSVWELQDHFTALRYIEHRLKPAPRSHQQSVDWSKLITEASKNKITDANNVTEAPRLDRQIIPGSRDEGFQNGMNASPGWIDLELLLRTLAQVQARPLILSMPIAGDFYDHAGVSRSAREGYYRKLRSLVQQYGFPLIEFEGHDEDPAFLIRHKSHLTVKGWIYYNRALDDFFHGRMPQS